MIWDNEDCPVDGCDGELQQQDKYNVMCLTCEDIWTHWASGEEDLLVTEDHEIVARKQRTATVEDSDS